MNVITKTKAIIGQGFLLLLSKTRPDMSVKDSLYTSHNHDFIHDQQFVEAYNRGIKAQGYDLKIQWRAHVALWAASYAVHLDGDFVECGVNKGFMSSTIMQYLYWNSLNKTFYLLDTFHGIDETQLSKEEIALGRIEKNRREYSECYSIAIKNFAEFKRVKIIRGTIPFTLKRVDAKKVSYLAIDMNNAKPEIAAIEFFWPRIVRGGIVVLDDYAYNGYLPQKRAMDQFAEKVGIKILSLPTGQGILIK